jgi:hypothetical protein
MKNTTTPDTAFVKAATDQALLNLPAGRLPALAAAAAPVHELLKSLTAVDLGETAPATSFNASWE